MSDSIPVLALVVIALLALTLLLRLRRLSGGREGAVAPKRSRGRYVYVIARQDRRGRAVGPVKLGIARDPEARLKTFQTANPQPLVLYRTFKVVHARALERDVHCRLRPFRLKGEWFALSPERAVTAVHVVLDIPRRGLVPAWHRLALHWQLRGEPRG